MSTEAWGILRGRGGRMFLRLKREDVFGLLWRMVWGRSKSVIYKSGRIAERRKEKV